MQGPTGGMARPEQVSPETGCIRASWVRGCMSKRAVITLAILMLVWIEGGGQLSTAAQMPLSSQVSEYLWERLLIAGTPPVLRVAGDSVRSGNFVMQFYTRRLYWPAWSNDAGLLPPQINHLLQALREAEHEGLRPRDYHLTRLESLLAEAAEPCRPPERCRVGRSRSVAD